MGPAMFFATAGHVRIRDLERTQKTPGARPRPAGNYAALLCPSRGRHFLWFRAEGHFRPSRDPPALESERPRLLPVDELRSVPLDPGGGHRETSSWSLAGMGERNDARRLLLAPASRDPGAVSGVRHGDPRFPFAGIDPGTPYLRRTLGSVVERRRRFLRDPPLRGCAIRLPAQDIFDLLSRTHL